MVPTWDACAVATRGVCVAFERGWSGRLNMQVQRRGVLGTAEGVKATDTLRSAVGVCEGGLCDLPPRVPQANAGTFRGVSVGGRREKALGLKSVEGTQCEVCGDLGCLAASHSVVGNTTTRVA